MNVIQALKLAKLNLITSVVVGVQIEEMSELAANAIAAALRNDTHLRSLKISCGVISGVNFKIILNALIDNTTLTSINFRILDTRYLDTAVIMQALQMNTTLKSIRLWISEISDTQLKAIAKYLQVNRSLENLYLHSLKGFNSGDGFNHLVRALAANTSLRSFYSLYGNYNDGVNAQVIARLLQKNTSLQSLSFDRVSGYGVEDAKIIAAALESNTTLQSIRFDGMFENYDATNIFIEALGVNTALRAVSLKDSSVDDAGLQRLAQHLRTNTSITMLDLSENSFGKVGVDALCTALYDNQTLRTLNLSSVDLSSQSLVKSISTMLQRNHSLTSLDLACCCIFDCISVLAKGLKINTSLKSIDLSMDVEGEDIESIASVLRVNRTLTSLKLFYSPITAQEIALFVEALQENQVLTTLGVPDSDEDEDGEEREIQLVRLNQKLEQNRRRGQFVTSPHGLKNVVLYSLFAKPLAVPDVSQILPHVVKCRLTECATSLNVLDEHILGRAILAGYCVEPRLNPSILPKI
jgi:Leucine Rich repeat